MNPSLWGILSPFSLRIGLIPKQAGKNYFPLRPRGYLYRTPIRSLGMNIAISGIKVTRKSPMTSKTTMGITLLINLDRLTWQISAAT
jgi:hypothetical protein